jgi:hypothetical protein
MILNYPFSFLLHIHTAIIKSWYTAVKNFEVLLLLTL